MRSTPALGTRRAIMALAIVSLVTLGSGCRDSETVEPNPNNDPPDDPLGGEVVVTGEFAEVPDSQPYQLLSAELDGRLLTVRAQVSGGCEDHAYTLYIDSAFRESYPVQTWAYIYDGTDDPCDSLFEEEIVFDITPIVDEYIEAYGSDDEIWIHLFDGAAQSGAVDVRYVP